MEILKFRIERELPGGDVEELEIFVSPSATECSPVNSKEKQNELSHR
jgi:hypothetical protein